MEHSFMGDGGDDCRARMEPEAMKSNNKPRLVFREFNSPLKQSIVYKSEKDKLVPVLNYTAPEYYISGRLKYYNWKTVSEKCFHIIRQVLLPAGWPHTVSDDYIDYQIWDSAQAFCSSITGILATRAVLVGIGVGHAESNAVSATITWILKDGTGMVGRIIFAWLKGKNLDTECKKWRLFADVLNDSAMGIELIIPSFMSLSTSLLCVSTSMKAIVGVAGGATRAAITQHQAIRGNTGDVSAKDGSQETFVNLCASIFGVILLSVVPDGGLDGILFIFFCLLHMYANYKAVKALNLKILNEERYVLLLSHYLVSNIILTPRIVNDKESVVLGFGFNARNLCNFNIVLGCSLSELQTEIPSSYLESLLDVYGNNRFILALHPNCKTICVIFEGFESSENVLFGYYSAIYYGLALSLRNNLSWKKLALYHSTFYPLNRIRQLNITPCKLDHKLTMIDLTIEEKQACHNLAKEEFEIFREKSITAGWQLHTHQLHLGEWRYHKDKYSNSPTPKKN